MTYAAVALSPAQKVFCQGRSVGMQDQKLDARYSPSKKQMGGRLLCLGCYLRLESAGLGTRTAWKLLDILSSGFVYLATIGIMYLLATAILAVLRTAHTPEDEKVQVA